MDDLLLCSNDPILIKGLYGVLRDNGYKVEVVNHSAHAVKKTFKNKYSVIIIESESIGLSAEEAAQIIKSFHPDVPIIIAGDAKYSSNAMIVKRPIDFEEIKQLIGDIQKRNFERRGV